MCLPSNVELRSSVQCCMRQAVLSLSVHAALSATTAPTNIGSCHGVCGGRHLRLLLMSTETDCTCEYSVQCYRVSWLIDK